MDNFNFKKYLVENKLTYQEKMKVKAEKKKSLKEDEDLDEVMGGDAVQMAQELNMDYETIKQMAVALGMGVPALIAVIGAGGPAIKKFFKEKLGRKGSVSSMAERKEQEQGKKAPKDKQKQDPSSLNESKIFFGGY
jgi:hypothetical protein